MSGTCLTKKGRRYFCSQCEADGLKADFEFCPYRGQKIVMRWDHDKDRQIVAAHDGKGK